MTTNVRFYTMLSRGSWTNNKQNEKKRLKHKTFLSESGAPIYGVVLH